MATNFTRPTLAELIERVKSDIEGQISGAAARLRRRFEFGLAKAVAAAANGLHAHLAWVAEQIIIDRAEDEFVLRWGDMFGVDRRAATQATGNITVTGTGGTLPAGTEWVRASDGAIFTVNAEATNVTSSTVAVTSEEAGEDYNMTVGEELSLASPISGIDGTATVAAGGLTGGEDVEDIDDYRERVLDRIQDPPMGGAPGDHVTWAMEVTGVGQAWEFGGKDGVGNLALGKVSVTFVTNDENDPIPSGAEVTAVQEYLDARSPAEVVVFAPTGVPLALDIRLTPNTVAVQNAVIAEIKDMLARDREPGGTVYLSRIREAISAAAGETSHVLVSPVADVEHAFGEIPTYQLPTWG